MPGGTLLEFRCPITAPERWAAELDPVSMLPSIFNAAQILRFTKVGKRIIHHMRKRNRRWLLGLTNTGALLEVPTPNGRRSWAIRASMPDGSTCFVAAGETWKTIPPVAVVEYGA